MAPSTTKTLSTNFYTEFVRQSFFGDIVIFKFYWCTNVSLIEVNYWDKLSMYLVFKIISVIVSSFARACPFYRVKLTSFVIIIL